MKFPSSDGRVVIVKADQKMGCLKVVIRPPKEDNILAHVEISTNVERDPKPLIDQGAESIEKLENICLTNNEHYT
ncbi:hypothetical protein CR513_61476, partial [Mucuna pruriens]